MQSRPAVLRLSGMWAGEIAGHASPGFNVTVTPVDLGVFAVAGN